MADITLYDLATLDEVYRNIKTPTPPFYLNAFTRQINFDTPEIMFDKVSGDDRGLAPFVLPTVQGRPQRLSGYSTDRFRPAYVKIKDVVDPSMHLSRMPGEAPIIGSMTIGQRRDAVIAELLRMAKVKFANRNEWLAAKALIDGEVTISGEDYPTVVVGFGRDSDLTITLTTGARWSQNTSDPLADIKAARIVCNGLSGSRVRKIVFGQDAWDYFAAQVDLKEFMNRNYGGNDGSSIKLMSDGYDGQEFMGVIQGNDGGGRIEAWVDTSKYLDENGDEQFYLDQNTVCGYADVQGVRCFGAIMDAKAGYQPLDFFFKNWMNEDPSVEYLLSQSAPLMVPKNPNASFSILVHS
jgi:hypothetical protein